MRITPRFQGLLRATERRKSALHRNIQLLLVLVIVMAGLPFAFAPPAAANAVTAYGCTIDPEKPKLNDGKLAAKARIQCSNSLQGRAIRTDLQQRRADSSYYTVAKSIVVRDVPNVMTGQWYGAGSDWVGGCKKVSGTRKFKSVVMITDGVGNVEQTASNPEDFDRDYRGRGLCGRVGGINTCTGSTRRAGNVRRSMECAGVAGWTHRSSCLA